MCASRQSNPARGSADLLETTLATLFNQTPASFPYVSGPAGAKFDRGFITVAEAAQIPVFAMISSRFGDRNKAPVEALRGRGTSAKRLNPLAHPIIPKSSN
jgi:hypothetical protein